MKCHICGYEIPSGRKYCPGCGRVLSVAEQKKATESVKTNSDNSIVYRPASTGKSKTFTSNTNIPDIFSSDPNAPEYRDPHTYDRATADILEYDRMFVSRKNEKTDFSDNTYDYGTPVKNIYNDSLSDTAEYKNDETDYTIEQEYEEDNSSGYYDDAEDDNEKKAKPRLNIKLLIICIALIAGLAVIIMGTYQIGKQVGFWGEKEQSSDTDEENRTLGEKAPVVKEPDSTTVSPSSNYKIGVYTLNAEQNNVFVYKGVNDDRIVATIPNGTVVEITEVSDDMGKTTYGTYTGWLNMEELVYTPAAKLPEKETTSNKPEVTSENDENNNNEEPPDENNTPDSPGTYTVDLRGDGTYVNVRDTSSTDGTVVSTVDEGVQVTVDKVEHGWGHITTPDGVEGWIYMVYLK